MPRPKRPSQLQQKTLTGFVQSSPPGPSTPVKRRRAKSTANSSPIMPKTERFLSRSARKTTWPPNDDEGGASGSDSSDVRAIPFEPKREEPSEDESPRRPAKKRKAADGKSSQAAIVVLSSDDGDESEPVKSPIRRRKLVKGVRPMSSEDEGERERRDDSDLEDEVEKERIIEPRLRARDGKKTAYQKNLEKLKRKKRGQPSLTSSEESEEEGEESEDEEPAPFTGAKPHKSSDESDADSLFSEREDAQDSFIVEDDPNASAVIDLPVEFSMSTHQDLAHHFKIVCQFLVHIAVRPRAERRAFVNQVMTGDKYWSVSLQAMRRKLNSMRDSLVVSSMWKPHFKDPLCAYPVLEVSLLDFTLPGCDACQMGSRKSTRLGKLRGRKYDRRTYEPLSDSDSSDSSSSDSDSSSSSSNSDHDDDDDDDKKSTSSGDSTSTKKEFNMGRFCAARTRAFHQFMHWEHRLYNALALEIETARNSAAGTGYVSVAFAGGLKPPDDENDADGYMHWLDQRGIIDMQWKDIRDMMESARNLEMQAKGGDRDD